MLAGVGSDEIVHVFEFMALNSAPAGFEPALTAPGEMLFTALTW
jgi:hypothetical protein